MSARFTKITIAKRFLSLQESTVKPSRKVSHIALTKKGTASGPFVELPEFEPLQDSILVKLPASCILHSKLDKISVVNVESNATSKPFLSIENEENQVFSKLVTADRSVNAMLVSGSPMSNVTVLQLDNYKEGWILTNPEQNVLCYSGDLTLDKGHLKGSGVAAINGDGPVYWMKLESKDNVLINPDSIIGYQSSVSLSPTKTRSTFVIPPKIKQWFEKYLDGYYDKFLLNWGKLFNSDKVYCRIQGPGNVLLQANFAPGSKILSDNELLQAFKG